MIIKHSVNKTLSSSFSVKSELGKSGEKMHRRPYNSTFTPLLRLTEYFPMTANARAHNDSFGRKSSNIYFLSENVLQASILYITGH